MFGKDVKNSCHKTKSTKVTISCDFKIEGKVTPPNIRKEFKPLMLIKKGIKWATNLYQTKSPIICGLIRIIMIINGEYCIHLAKVCRF